MASDQLRALQIVFHGTTGRRQRHKAFKVTIASTDALQTFSPWTLGTSNSGTMKALLSPLWHYNSGLQREWIPKGCCRIHFVCLTLFSFSDSRERLGTVPSWVVHNLDSSFRSTTAGSASIRTERHILRLPSFSFLGIRNEPVTGIPANFTAALSIDVGWSNPRDHMYDYPRGPDPNMRIPSHSQFKAARGTPFRLRPESLL